MNSSLMLDITQIPTQLGGLASVTRAIAVAMLAFLIPYTTIELNVRAMHAKNLPDYGGFLIRTVVVMSCLLCYNTLYSFLLQGSQVMSFAVLSEQQWGDFLVQTFHGSDGNVTIFSVLLHSITSVQQLVLFLSSLIAVIARDVVVMLQACFLSLLYAFGPIAIACGISERTTSVLRGWIANSFQVAFWSFFLRLLVRVWLSLSPYAGNTGTGLANDFLGILTVNTTFLLLVLGTPIFAARMISGEGLAGFAEAASAAIQTVTIAGSLKAGRMAGGAMDRHKQNKAHAAAKASRDAGAKPQFSTGSTATAAHDQLFGSKDKPGQNGEQEKGKSAS